MRNARWILLLAALAGACWLCRADHEAAADGSGAAVVSTQPNARAGSSGYRITGANWSTDPSLPVYVPPHQRRALQNALRRKADAAARSLDERTPLEDSALATRVRPGSVIADPQSDDHLGEVGIE